ncbi:TetR/AcrR family transcriptional regulator [Fulvimarina sp. 2208YS6-2-32]|uniref:TetR/AcrR family transcriptional regulator n=1 Tax=Fulvimarina uroteuthidis TaxID=3098149 RepID=A0ABU5I4N8_9HYPH|nr:TetR/AcrR family transcriptional regulator [Fulvimarina sp. 2208YS6-2-32]MDY8110332.1 TetR/AcrR family transcriptional regulator [Fulvimarina sp. 2208YS6-2-32]
MAVGTRDALIHTAENLMRTRGYTAFSYADLSEAVGIRKASIHHHFPTKEDLGTAIVEDYIDRVRIEFGRIEAEHGHVIARLEAFFQLFRSGSDGGLLPLCGALAAEMSALPLGLQRLTQCFFDMQLNWLTGLLEQGMHCREIPRGSGARQKAFLLLSLLEGASFVNWATRDEDSLSPNVVRLVVEHA